MIKWLYLACGMINFGIVVDLVFNRVMPSITLLGVWGFYLSVSFIALFYKKYLFEKMASKVMAEFEHLTKDIVNDKNLTVKEKNEKIAEVLFLDMQKKGNNNNQTGDKK